MIRKIKTVIRSRRSNRRRGARGGRSKKSRSRSRRAAAGGRKEEEEGFDERLAVETADSLSSHDFIMIALHMGKFLFATARKGCFEAPLPASPPPALRFAVQFTSRGDSISLVHQVSIPFPPPAFKFLPCLTPLWPLSSPHFQRMKAFHHSFLFDCMLFQQLWDKGATEDPFFHFTRIVAEHDLLYLQ